MSSEGQAALATVLREIEKYPATDFVDLGVARVGVNKDAAVENRGQLLKVLKNYYPYLNRLKKGPSFIEVGHSIGDQTAALSLLAIGKSAGLWGIVKLPMEGSPWIIDVKID